MNGPIKSESPGSAFMRLDHDAASFEEFAIALEKMERIVAEPPKVTVIERPVIVAAPKPLERILTVEAPPVRIEPPIAAPALSRWQRVWHILNMDVRDVWKELLRWMKG